jgi:hypothetical protein
MEEHLEAKLCGRGATEEMPGKKQELLAALEIAP